MAEHEVDEEMPAEEEPEEEDQAQEETKEVEPEQEEPVQHTAVPQDSSPAFMDGGTITHLRGVTCGDVCKVFIYMCLLYDIVDTFVVFHIPGPVKFYKTL